MEIILLFVFLFSAAQAALRAMRFAVSDSPATWRSFAAANVLLDPGFESTGDTQLVIMQIART